MWMGMHARTRSWRNGLTASNEGSEAGAATSIYRRLSHLLGQAIVRTTLILCGKLRGTGLRWLTPSHPSVSRSSQSGNLIRLNSAFSAIPNAGVLDVLSEG